MIIEQILAMDSAQYVAFMCKLPEQYQAQIAAAVAQYIEDEAYMLHLVKDNCKILSEANAIGAQDPALYLPKFQFQFHALAACAVQPVQPPATPAHRTHDLANTHTTRRSTHATIVQHNTDYAVRFQKR